MEEELVDTGFVLLHREDSVIHRNFAVKPSGGTPTGPRRGKEERSPLTILDSIQGDLLSLQTHQPNSCEF